MANRLSSIVTRTGDDGTTGLGDGTRIRKDALRVVAMGDVDELNSSIGLLLSELLPQTVQELLLGIQHDLFDLGGQLCIPGHIMVTEAHVERLESALKLFNADLPRLAEFILPGGARTAALAHICRTIARRAERSVVALEASEVTQEKTEKNPRQYLNRLSDLMFVLARVLNRAAGGTDVLWQQNKNAYTTPNKEAK
jgi:cob(I)alamin adenosyltransferase